jgi:hypothetical protein
MAQAATRVYRDGRSMSAPDRGEAPDAGRRHLEDLLDEALQETFPASDPPAVGVEDALPPPARAAGRQAAASRQAAGPEGEAGAGSRQAAGPEGEAAAGTGSPGEQLPGGL